MRQRHRKAADRHVIPSGAGGWAVRKTGAERATRVFGTLREAEAYARALAEREHVRLYVHREDGTVQKRLSYQNQGAVAAG